MDKITILALDVATETGWATSTASGTWDLRPKRDESSGMRLIRFKGKLKEICKLEEINLIVFERSAGFHKGALIVQSELHGVLKSFCLERNIEYKAYSPAEIKRHATKKGNANKGMMIEAARERLGYTGDNDNQADALWLFDLAIKDLLLTI